MPTNEQQPANVSSKILPVRMSLKRKVLFIFTPPIYVISPLFRTSVISDGRLRPGNEDRGHLIFVNQFEALVEAEK